MAKSVDVTTVKGQNKAPPRKEPYYKKIAKGLYVGLYKSEQGAQSWWVRFHHEGKYERDTFDSVDIKSYESAVDAAIKFAEKTRKGEPSEKIVRAQQSKGALTVMELIEEYTQQESIQAAKGDRYDEWLYTVNRLSNRYVKPYLGNRRIFGLKKEDMESLQAKLKKEVKPETVNRGTANFRAALNYALGKGYLPQGAFWKEVKLEEESEPDDKELKPYLPADVRKDFLDTATPPLLEIVTCLHMTGCRPSEARRLTVDDVRADARRKDPHLRLMTFKGNRASGTSRKFPLSGERLEFFKGLAAGRDKDEPLFKTEKGLEWSMANLNKRHNAVRDALGLDRDVVSYCWRHSFIQDLVDKGMHTLKIAKLVGTSEKYIRDFYTSTMELDVNELPEL